MNILYLNGITLPTNAKSYKCLHGMALTDLASINPYLLAIPNQMSTVVGIVTFLWKTICTFIAKT